jgi:hypothetical protein
MVTKSKETKSTVKAAPAKTTASSKTTPAKKSSAKSASHDEIAKHAFMLWQQRGGSAIQNWLDAERSLS